MARLHLTFKNIRPSTKNATAALFDSRPWSGTDEEKQTKYEEWLRKASASYGVPAPTLEVITEPTEEQFETLQSYTLGQINLGSWSVTTLFHNFRHHLQVMGACTAEAGDCQEAQAWACSLFYSVKPRQFRRRVREGRIAGVWPDDLLTAESLELQRQELYGEDLVVDTTTGSHDSLRPEEDDETEVPAEIVDRSPEVPALEIVDSPWVQETFGVSRSFVSTHAERMGGWKPEGSARWQFNPQVVREYMAERETSNA